MSDLLKKITYEEFVASIKKPGEDILTTLTPEKSDLLHMAIGISGEAGELLDAIKKHVIYNKELDIKNVKEELGDLEFFMEGLRQRLGIHRTETISGNVTKLEVRYKGLKYSDQAAQNRADKNETPTGNT